MDEAFRQNIVNSGYAANDVYNYVMNNQYLESEAGKVAGVLNTLMGDYRDLDNAWSASQAEIQRNWSAEEAEKNRIFNMVEAAKNRDWQEMMSNTAHVREVQDLMAAGLNPILSALGGNGAAVGSGATAAGVGNPSGSSANGNQSTGMALASVLSTVLANQTKLTEQVLNANLQHELTDKTLANAQYLGELNAWTSRMNAQTNAGAVIASAERAAAASMYGSDNALTNSREQRQWDAEHPNNVYSTVAGILDTVGVTAGLKDTIEDYGGFGNWIVDSTFAKGNFEWSNFWKDFNSASTDAQKQAVVDQAAKGKYSK